MPAAPAPLVELRQFARRFTLRDAEAGLVPIRQSFDGGRTVVLFAPPVLQSHFQVKAPDGSRQWTEWADVPVVREGIEDV